MLLGLVMRSRTTGRGEGRNTEATLTEKNARDLTAVEGFPECCRESLGVSEGRFVRRLEATRAGIGIERSLAPLPH
jgi:hypothetical protein